MTIRIGIVGCGAIASYLHAPAIAMSKFCQLNAAVDVDLNRALGFAAAHGVPHAAKEIGEVADRIDAVLLATPPHVRPRLVHESATLGLHVICEKPLANSVDECIEIAEIGDRHVIKIAVFHQFRFWPNRVRIGQMICNGSIPRPIRFSVELGHPYSWDSVSGYTVKKAIVPGGVLINAGIHPLDMLIAWFGNLTASEYSDDSFGGLESNVRVSMKFGDDIEGSFRISRTCNLSNRISISSCGNTLLFDNDDPFHFQHRKSDGEVELIRVADPSDGFLRPAADLYDDFAYSIIEGTGPRVDAMDGAKVIRWIEEWYRLKAQRDLPFVAPLPGLTW
jgi:predicted dehydrogenase